MLEDASFWALVAALATCGVIIIGAMTKGMLKDRAERAEANESAP